DSRYQAWIDMYASSAFEALSEWCRELLDRVGAGLPPSELRAVEDAFVTSSRYEYLFWEMAWKLETWPV
ncbi:MAG: thiaminase II, partial [Chloroflexi bacterium]|nr:thiaminase II [Chloroflexota bacterium]